MILNRDLKMAGIPKRDERGKTSDVHALRHTFGTLMSKGGVSPRTAQAAMRHSDIKLTMNVYTDPKLLDVRGAMDTLPTFALNGPMREEATGTDGGASRTLALPPAQTADEAGQSQTITVHPFTYSIGKPVAVSGKPVNGKGRLSLDDNRPLCGAEGDRTPDLLNGIQEVYQVWIAENPSVSRFVTIHRFQRFGRIITFLWFTVHNRAWQGCDRFVEVQ